MNQQDHEDRLARAFICLIASLCFLLFAAVTAFKAIPKEDTSTFVSQVLVIAKAFNDMMATNDPAPAVQAPETESVARILYAVTVPEVRQATNFVASPHLNPSAESGSAAANRSSRAGQVRGSVRSVQDLGIRGRPFPGLAPNDPDQYHLDRLNGDN